MTKPTLCVGNRLDPRLVRGTHVLGSKYQCLRKGFGTGSHLPYDPKYLLDYEPVDPRRFYCGTKDLPEGYFADGSPAICFRKGLGAGRRVKAVRKAGRSSFLLDESKSSDVSLPLLVSQELSDSSMSISEDCPDEKHASFGFGNKNGNCRTYQRIALMAMVFIFLYIFKPWFVMEEEKGNKRKVINWNKFLFYYLLIFGISVGLLELS